MPRAPSHLLVGHCKVANRVKSAAADKTTDESFAIRDSTQCFKCIREGARWVRRLSTEERRLQTRSLSEVLQRPTSCGSSELHQCVSLSGTTETQACPSSAHRQSGLLRSGPDVLRSLRHMSDSLRVSRFSAKACLTLFLLQRDAFMKESTAKKASGCTEGFVGAVCCPSRTSSSTHSFVAAATSAYVPACSWHERSGHDTHQLCQDFIMTPYVPLNLNGYSSVCLSDRSTSWSDQCEKPCTWSPLAKSRQDAKWDSSVPKSLSLMQ